jgi:hypothetical protein
MTLNRESPLDIEEQIDVTLRILGSVDPRPGLEQRIAARLADIPTRQSARLLGLPRFAFASAAGALAAVVIIAGSVNHSHRILPLAPGVQLPVGASTGFGPASAAQVAPKPIAPPAGGHARSMRGAPQQTELETQRKPANEGRAVISPGAHKPARTALPKSPALNESAPDQ